MGRVCLFFAAALLLASCREDVPQQAPSPQATETGLETPAPVVVLGARTVSEETDDFVFDYAYPADPGHIPELAELLGRRLDAARAEIAGQSADAREAAHEDGFPFNKFSSGTKWQVVADTPGFLSLSSSMTSYTGGAHGIYGYDALVWDRENAVPLEPDDFFTSLDALDDVLSGPFCEVLNRERAVRRGEAVEEGSQDMFDLCVPLRDTTLLLGSSSGQAFNRIGVQIGPYVAGPYAEGSYEFTFPVTAQVLDVVKDDYRSAFAVR